MEGDSRNELETARWEWDTEPMGYPFILFYLSGPSLHSFLPMFLNYEKKTLILTS